MMTSIRSLVSYAVKYEQPALGDRAAALVTKEYDNIAKSRYVRSQSLSDFRVVKHRMQLPDLSPPARPASTAPSRENSREMRLNRHLRRKTSVDTSYIADSGSISLLSATQAPPTEPYTLKQRNESVCFEMHELRARLLALENELKQPVL